MEWLLKQEGYRRLPKDLPSYIELPKAAFAKAMERSRRDFLKIEEAVELLEAMPCKSISERRTRAIFAIAFLGALRADTISSLRVKDVDTVNKRINQDGAAVRSKNGKSLRIFWFPVPERFEQEVLRWLAFMEEQGFREDDALFPDLDQFTRFGKRVGKGLDPVPVLNTTHAITAAFKSASAFAEQDYTPHSAKHSIAWLRDQLSLTHAQRRAWSENMGHETESITETHYAKFTDDERANVMEKIDTTEKPLKERLSDEDKIRLVDEILGGVKQQGQCRIRPGGF